MQELAICCLPTDIWREEALVSCSFLFQFLCELPTLYFVAEFCNSQAGVGISHPWTWSRDNLVWGFIQTAEFDSFFAKVPSIGFGADGELADTVLARDMCL